MPVCFCARKSHFSIAAAGDGLHAHKVQPHGTFLRDSPSVPRTSGTVHSNHCRLLNILSHFYVFMGLRLHFYMLWNQECDTFLCFVRLSRIPFKPDLVTGVCMQIIDDNCRYLWPPLTQWETLHYGCTSCFSPKQTAGCSEPVEKSKIIFAIHIATKA